MVPELIKFFELVAVSSDEKLLDAVKVNEAAMKCGYIVHPDACTADVLKFLETQEVNLNSTFYKNWATVEKLSELEMYILQMLHYMSTYGTDYTGPAFTMNDIPDEMQFSKFTLLMPCSERELFERVSGMLNANVALSESTLDLLVEQLSLFYEKYGWRTDVDEVGNHEALARLCKLYNVLPSQPLSLFRYLVYCASGSSLVIKNSTAFSDIVNNDDGVVADILESLNAEQLRGLSSVFYRFKPLFLAMRKNAVEHDRPKAKGVINEIRRLARRYHKPLEVGVLESILNANHSPETVSSAIAEETNLFKLVKLANYLEQKISPTPFIVYLIRNGKVFIKESRKKEYPDSHAGEIAAMIKARIIELLNVKSKDASGKALTVRFPADIDLAAPASEKMFVGNVPYGSSYTLLTNNYIGIYWKNSWGTRDFDLWMVDPNGNHIGWAANHKSDQVMFSGDMTDADPEATEVFYGKDKWPDCTIRVLRFNGEQGSKYRLFFGNDNITDLSLNYMVNPDSIRFQEDMISDKKEQVVGIIHDKKVYFSSINAGNKRIPDLPESFTFESALGEKFSSYIKLKNLLIQAGFIEYDEKSGNNPDIDLENLSKDTLITLFK